MRAVLLASIAILMTVPPATADDPLYDPTCPVGRTCVGPGECTPHACVPRACGPLLHCRSELTPASECAENATIQGETCQGVVGAGVRTPGGADAWVGLSLSEGHVDAFNLPNTWTSPAAQASLAAGDADAGTTSVGVYKSVIRTDREWTNVYVVVHHGQGATSSDTLVVGVRLLDGVPEGCYLAHDDSPLARCPTERDVHDTLP